MYTSIQRTYRWEKLRTGISVLVYMHASRNFRSREKPEKKEEIARDKLLNFGEKFSYTLQAHTIYHAKIRTKRMGESEKKEEKNPRATLFKCTYNVYIDTAQDDLCRIQVIIFAII